MSSQTFLGQKFVFVPQQEIGNVNAGITLDAVNGVISGVSNFNTTVNLNQPNQPASFQSLTLNDSNVPSNSTADRFVAQLPNNNDVLRIPFDGRVERWNTTTLTAPWVLGAPESNNGYSFRINTSQPNLQLYAPDSGSQIALYNSSNSGYAWVIPPSGDATFGNVTHRGTSFFNGQVNCNANVGIVGGILAGGNISATGSVFSGGLPVQVDSIGVNITANYTVPNDGRDRDIYVSAGASNIVVLVPTDPPRQQCVNLVIFNGGTAPFIGVGTGSPAIQFVGNGSQSSTVNLTGQVNKPISFRYVDYGTAGDWWLWSVN